LVIDGEATVGGNDGNQPILTQDPTLENNPPLGYASDGAGVQVVPGSWIWDAAP
jgi:hypothetical protein